MPRRSKASGQTGQMNPSPKSEPKPKHAGGRPSKYDPAFCEVTIDLMTKGFSLGAVAGEIGVSRQTLDTWTKEHPEFLDAVKTGRAKAQLFWEQQLMRVAERGGGPGTATAVIFGLKNRAADDWRDKQEFEHSGPDGQAVTFTWLAPS